MLILEPCGQKFNALGIFGLEYNLLFESCSTYCAEEGPMDDIFRAMQMHIRYLLRFFDCLAHPNLSATFATDQK